MYHKSLMALAVLGVFATTTIAAEVTLYGKIDAGFIYQNLEETDVMGKKDTTDALKLDSGVGQASRFGIKATEDLGNGYKVSFKLENGFKGDDGSSLKNDRLFDREASLTVESNWGKLTAGRYGAFSAAAGGYDVVYSRGDSFDGGHKDVLGFATFSRMDNMLTYQIPKIAGFQATAQYSFKTDKDGDGDEGHSSTDRYAGMALTYDIGALQTAFSYEQKMRGSDTPLDDARIFHLGGNYDFDAFKLFVMGQYFEDVAFDEIGMAEPFMFDVDNTKLTADGLEIEGYGLHVGTRFDALAGHFDLGLYYVDAETEYLSTDVDGEYWGAVGRYIYSLSKRTNLRFAVGVDQTKWDTNNVPDMTDKFKAERYFGSLALTHNF